MNLNEQILKDKVALEKQLKQAELNLLRLQGALAYIDQLLKTQSENNNASVA